MDAVLKVELVLDLYFELPRFYEALLEEIEGLEKAVALCFIKCQKGNNPLFSERFGWRDWPQGAKKKDVWKWFAGRWKFDRLRGISLLPIDIIQNDLQFVAAILGYL